jgi:hypothetical protein
VFAHFAGYMGRNDVAIIQLNAKRGIGQSFDHFALHFDVILFRHKPLSPG